jgi:hypothetical protein
MDLPKDQVKIKNNLKTNNLWKLALQDRSLMNSLNPLK